ncbi:class I SAM-dependent methyltransferase [Metabacillus herbersteinensis]|uniref:Class I SAM-dependent methyltransferase n=1 Tax=Metabacillus herbersteinensis TaxID=283816 RepID=A0ABV6GLB8_9BACI
MHAEQFTASYTEQGDIHKEVFLNPTILKMIETIDNKKILDAGCGEGYLSRILAQSGASVVAVDYSKKMLEIAEQKTSDNLKITYHHGNCENLDFLEEQSFNLIISNMVIQDLENYQEAIQEMHRLLVDGGCFIFSILHPCFVTPESGWVKNDDGEKIHWKVDKYFYEGVYEQVFPQGHKEKLLLFHRTLTSYFNAITEAGFTLEGLVEPKPSEEMLKKYPSFEEDFRCSDFIVFKVRK